MFIKNWRRRDFLLWQFLLLALGTSWLWASQLNAGLSYRTSLISQIEAPGEPFSWLFRFGDFAAGALVFLLALYLLKIQKTYGWLLLALSVGMMFDPLVPTTCRTVGDTCREYFSVAYLFHAIEAVYTAALFFIIAVYDALRRKKLISVVFIVFQIGYGILFISQLADQQRFNTLSQYVYQATLILWLAWLCRDLISEKIFRVSIWEKTIVRTVAAGWAFLNGVLAIVLSIAHLSLLGRINGVYFSNDTAWLAQHGIIVGVVMLYLARHLARGEARARQLFLILCGTEVLKYSLLSPNAGFLAFYSLTFIALFLLRDDFDRGTMPLTWSIRLRDFYFLVSGLLLAALVALLFLDRDNRASTTTARAIRNLSAYVFRDQPLPHRHISSALLAHSLTVFIVAGTLAVLWVLFRPYKTKPERFKDFYSVEKYLRRYSASSEDFFKLWPPDKSYYWGETTPGFIAYKQVGSTVFGLADPIGPEPKKLVEEFNSWGRRHRLKVCYLPVYPASLGTYESAGLETIQIGSGAMVDIKLFLNETIKEKWWRWRINKAQKSSYQYQALAPPHSPGLLLEMRRVSDTWLSGGGRTERGFALGHFDDEYLQRCRIHCLRDATGRLIAFTNEVPQFRPGRVLTVDLLRSDPDTESMAYLLYKVIQSADESKAYTQFDLGFVPFAKAKGPLLTIAKTVSADSFSAKGLEQFKNKFNPNWQPYYLAYDGDVLDLGAIALNIEKAMAPLEQSKN